MEQKKLELILGNKTTKPELLFKDLKKLHTLSKCQNSEPVTIGHEEEAIMNTYGLTQRDLEKNLNLYQTWLDNQ